MVARVEPSYSDGRFQENMKITKNETREMMVNFVFGGECVCDGKWMVRVLIS